jgi:hypothetical protein
MVTLNYFWSIGLHGVKLLVTEEDATEALEILRCELDAEQSDGRVQEEDLHCPVCDSSHTRYETYDLRVAYLASLLGYFPHIVSQVCFVVLLPALLALIPKREWVCLSCGYGWRAAREPVPSDRQT